MFTEYAVLAWLTARRSRPHRANCFAAAGFWLSLLVVIAYSLSDEFHQSFVPSRTARFMTA